MQKFASRSIFILILINLIIGLLVFRDYGLSWDEPLFYDYAAALQKAYSPAEWFSGSFDVDNYYGASGSDHANRGPAYVLLGQPLVNLIQRLGLDLASAWHLANFLCFQLGVYLLYRFAKQFVSGYAALASAALFAWQPLLWGHAFINPKDIPFLVFFLGAVCFGMEFVNDMETPQKSAKVLLAGFFLGIAASIRVLGPLAAVLVCLYAAPKINKRNVFTYAKTFLGYALFAMTISFAFWPHLWENPLGRFIAAFGFMSDNPTQLPVLFNGQTFPADQLPRRYLPTLLLLTLTEPALILSALGLFFAFLPKQKITAADYRPLITDYRSLSPLILWFLIPFAYVIVLRPPMYDGYRHFLFILPPVFVFAAFAFERIFSAVKKESVFVLLSLLLLAPSLYSSFKLHPYQYAYYNIFIGGTSGAFRLYETEYWLTCYKESVGRFNKKDVNLFVKREPYIAAYYAGEDIRIRDYRTEFGKIQSGDYVLVNTRTNEDRKTFKDAPVILDVRRGNAIFCEVKQIP